IGLAVRIGCPSTSAVGRSTTTPPTSCDFQPSGTPSSRGHQGRATRGFPERSRPFVHSSAHRRDHVSHVDLYLSTGDPYWPDEEAARAAKAGMGPITNSIGMNLTAITVRRPVTLEPDPHGDLRSDTPLDQCTRGMAGAVDETGLVWLCEKLIPVGDLDVPATS